MKDAGFCIANGEIDRSKNENESDEQEGATLTPIVADVLPPIIIPPSSVILEATAVLTPAALLAGTASDNIDGILLPINDAPTTFPFGITVVTYSATDAAGNTATATQAVTVVDTMTPVITAPTAVTVTSADGQNITVNIGQATAIDIFIPVNITNDAPTTFPVGTTTVTWTATDANGNVSTTTQNVIVTLTADILAPVITVPVDVSVEATAITTSITLGVASSVDNRDGNVIVSNDAPTTFPLGITVVTYSATDAAGNTATATQAVTVVDTTVPTITAPATATATSPDGQNVTFNIGQAVATDIFTPVNITNDAPTTFPVGTTTITWTASDANGNVSTTTQDVLVTLTADILAPVITVSVDISVEATAITTSIALGLANATDAKDGNVAVSNDAPIIFPLGITSTLSH